MIQICYLLFFFFIFVVLLANISVSLSADDLNLAKCPEPFKCGKNLNIFYPFWDDSRVADCGLPDFELKCEDDSAEITISSIKYNVLEIDQVQKYMKIARKDISDNVCLPEYKNTTFDFTSFSLRLDQENLTLFYGCPTHQAAFSCEKDANTYKGINLMKGSVLWDKNVHHSECKTSIIVPLNLGSILGGTARSYLDGVLKEGFLVDYNDGRGENSCNQCKKSGGKCGNNINFTCLCPNGGDFTGHCAQNNNTVSKGDKGKKINTGLIVGVVLGSVAGVVLTLYFLYMRRRKQKTSPPSKFTSRNISSQRAPNGDLEIGGSGYFRTPIFSYSELEEATDNFDEKKEVGDGGFGTVYYGKLRDGRVVAVKRLYKNNYKRVEQFMNEIAILSRLRHKHLVTLYGCTSRHSRELLLVYEYISNGTIADHLHGDNVKPGKLSWTLRMKIAIESADALSYLHASDTIHRDVKSNNILLENNFDVKVADFGLSRLFPNDVTHVSTAPQGTPGYVDPEYFQCYQLTDKSDVYSFGVVLCELISSKPAVDISRHRYDINLSNMAINKIQNHSVHEFVDPHLGFETNFLIRKSITQVAELAFRCLQQDKDMRPSMLEVLEVLREIEKNDYNQADEIDIPSDEYLLKGNPPLSPNSVTDIWPSTKTTPNTSA